MKDINSLKNINITSLVASPLEGNMTFIGTDILNTSILGYLKNKIVSLFKNIKNILKDKKRKILIIIISIIWFVLILLKSLNINFFLTNILSYLTFANAGTGGGLISLLGGLVGKSIFAYFITTIILNKNNFNIKEYVKNFTKQFNIKDKTFIAFYLTGIGLSLIAYIFISGNGSIQNSIIGIVSIIMMLKVLYTKKGIIIEVLQLLSKKTPFLTNNLDSIITGCIPGFIIGILVSFLGTNLSYIVGIIILIIGIILSFIAKKQFK